MLLHSQVLLKSIFSLWNGPNICSVSLWLLCILIGLAIFFTIFNPCSILKIDYVPPNHILAHSINQILGPISRDGNVIGSKQIGLILTLPYLFKIIFIFIPLKKLNGMGWNGLGMQISHTCLLTLFNFFF